MFLGVSGHHKGFKYLSSTGRIYISRYVIFNEHEFPFQFGFLNTKREEHQFSYLPSLPYTNNSESVWQHNIGSDSSTDSTGDSTPSNNDPSVSKDSSQHVADPTTVPSAPSAPITNEN